MAWDRRYRRLEEGEIIRDTDECQNDDASWSPATSVGAHAPDPAYTSHRTYRRLILADGETDSKGREIRYPLTR